jgi:exodeoxyribonuclease V gamma subunit
VAGVIVGSDGWLSLAPPPADDAQAALQALLQGWARSVLVADAAPLPTALATGLAWLVDGDLDTAADVYDGTDFGSAGERSEPCLARCFPSFEALAGTPGFEDWTRALYQPFKRWLDEHVVWHPHQALA